MAHLRETIKQPPLGGAVSTAVTWGVVAGIVGSLLIFTKGCTDMRTGPQKRYAAERTLTTPMPGLARPVVTVTPPTQRQEKPASVVVAKFVLKKGETSEWVYRTYANSTKFGWDPSVNRKLLYNVKYADGTTLEEPLPLTKPTGWDEEEVAIQFINPTDQDEIVLVKEVPPAEGGRRRLERESRPKRIVADDEPRRKAVTTERPRQATEDAKKLPPCQNLRKAAWAPLYMTSKEDRERWWKEGKCEDTENEFSEPKPTSTE